MPSLCLPAYADIALLLLCRQATLSSFYVEDTLSHSHNGQRYPQEPAAAGAKRHSTHQHPARLPRLVPQTTPLQEAAGAPQQHMQQLGVLRYQAGQSAGPHELPGGAAAAAAPGVSTPATFIGAAPVPPAAHYGPVPGMGSAANGAGDGWQWAGSTSSSQRWLGSFGGLLVQTSFMSRVSVGRRGVVG